MESRLKQNPSMKKATLTFLALAMLAGTARAGVGWTAYERMENAAAIECIEKYGRDIKAKDFQGIKQICLEYYDPSVDNSGPGALKEGQDLFYVGVLWRLLALKAIPEDTVGKEHERLWNKWHPER
jgi:hypothetical protein